MSNDSSTEKKRRLIVFSLLIVALGVIVFGLALMFFNPQKPESSAQVVRTKEDTVQGGAGGVGTTKYNEKLKEHDSRQADAALKAGESFVPTPPVGQNQPTLDNVVKCAFSNFSASDFTRFFSHVCSYTLLQSLFIFLDKFQKFTT